MASGQAHSHRGFGGESLAESRQRHSQRESVPHAVSSFRLNVYRPSAHLRARTRTHPSKPSASAASEIMELRHQKALRKARSIRFCCICGTPFASGERPSRQHVPPKAIFAECDRNPPLILHAHAECNEAQSPLDTVIGQLIAVLHGKYPTPSQTKLEGDMFWTSEGAPAAGVRNLPLRTIIFRWARCFHAALYGEFLPDNGGMIFEPFPAGQLVDGRLVGDPVHPSREVLTRTFKQQAKAGRTDAVICYNEQCHYRCTWLTFDDGSSFCLFALRLYNWEDLGSPGHPRMGCVGWYFADRPVGATSGTKLRIPVSRSYPLDPFHW